MLKIMNKYYNSTITLNTSHNKSNDGGLDAHNLSARTLETKNSFKQINRKYSKPSKRTPRK